MSQAAKLQEPSVEEILASIRRIIADDDPGKTVKAAEPSASDKTSPSMYTEPAKAAASNSQDDIDAMLADLNARSKPVPSTSAPVPELPPAESGVPDVLEEAPPVPPAHFRGIDPDSDLVFADQASPAPPEPFTRGFDQERRPFAAEPAARTLLSNAAETAVDHAFGSLANTVISTHMRTLEDLVQEMLRPMLKAWLDDNLPSLVERIVRDEIERVARGRH